MSLSRNEPFIRYQLENTFNINQDILGFTCRPCNDHHRIHYQAGQYVQVCINDADRPTTLPLSIANACVNEPFLEFHLRYNETQNAVRRLFEQLKQDPVLKISGPYGTMTASNIKLDDNPLLLLAGGTGIAPFKALLEQWARLKHANTKPIELLWGISKPEDFYLSAFLKKMKKEIIHFNFEIILSQPSESGHETSFQMGFLDEYLQEKLRLSHYHQAYLSGPYPMVQKCQAALLDKGLAPEAILSDMLPAALSQHGGLHNLV